MEPFRLIDTVDTSYTGYKKLTKLYSHCSKFANVSVPIDFYKCNWFDANLCALFDAIIYKLNKEQNITFSTDFEYLNQKFDVFFRNGFLSDGNDHPDKQESTLPNKNFDNSDKEGFCSYLNSHLLPHRGMPFLNENMSGKIKEDLLEIFSNTHLHANTEDPFFVAGQYYPRLNKLKFTLVDIGDGFLPKIKKATNGEINNDIKAILWALAGNSSKQKLEGIPGGLGLSGIYDYCNNHNGILEIASGDSYWSSSYKNTIFQDNGIKIGDPFVGTTINLTFDSSIKNYIV